MLLVRPPLLASESAGRFLWKEVWTWSHYGPKMWCIVLGWCISESSPLSYRATMLVLLMLGNCCEVQRTVREETLYYDFTVTYVIRRRTPVVIRMHVCWLSSCYGDWRLFFWSDCCNPQNEPVLVSTDLSFTNRFFGLTIAQVTCVHFSRGPLSFSSPLRVSPTYRCV